MSNSEGGFIQFAISKLIDLEPTIPGLHERMCIRTLRMLLENYIAEIVSDEANSWVRILEVFIELRGSIRGLGSVNAGSNASKIYSTISAGMDVETPGHALDTVALYATDMEKIGFAMTVYCGAIDALELLAADKELMTRLGNNAPNTFAEIISKFECAVDYGKKLIERFLTPQAVDDQALNGEGSP
jgi:hypothetical protein